MPPAQIICLDRRAVLQAVLSAPLLGAGFAAVTTAHSAEPVSATTAITVATTVVKEIATAMRGDGGLGATLDAINGKLDIAIQQLAAIQRTLAYILDRVSNIKGDVADALSEEYAYRTRITIQEQVRRLGEIAERARRKGTPLDKGARTEEWDDWKSKYFQFDQTIGEFRISKESGTAEASLVGSACLALATSAWAYGMIDDTELVTRLDQQLRWLERMENPADARSVASNLEAAKAAEASALRNAQMSERDYTKLPLDQQIHVVRSEIAARLYASGQYTWCLETEFDTQYWQSASPSGYKSVGIYRSVLPIRLTVDLKPNANGTLLFGSALSDNRGGALFRPDGTPIFPAYGVDGTAESFGAIDRATCEKEAIGPLRYGPDTREAMDLEGAARKDPPVRIDHVLRNSKRWSSLANRDRKSHAVALDVLLTINLARLKQAFASACLDHIRETRIMVENFRRQFP